jgi:agmatinase
MGPVANENETQLPPALFLAHAVMAQTPGGLSWVQIRKLIHGLVKKGRVLGMDLVEIAPTHDVGNTTMVHAERLICNFIGATVRAGYYR